MAAGVAIRHLVATVWVKLDALALADANGLSIPTTTRRHKRPMDVRESYDAAAQGYAEHLATELDGKPLDRHLLNRFAEAMRGRGVVADLGCGPGHVAGYLHQQGVHVVGIDLSRQMVHVASGLHPHLEFRVGDMRQLDLPTNSLAGAAAFYSIVHMAPAELGSIFNEVRRVLKPQGLVLLAFHIGNHVLSVDELFGVRVQLEFVFHEPSQVVQSLRSAQLTVIEHVEREPYEGAEHPSRRCYLLAQADG